MTPPLKNRILRLGRDRIKHEALRTVDLEPDRSAKKTVKDRGRAWDPSLLGPRQKIIQYSSSGYRDEAELFGDRLTVFTGDEVQEGLGLFGGLAVGDHVELPC